MRVVYWRAAVIVLVALMVAACQRAPDEQQVRDAIAAATEAAEAVDAAAFGKHLSDDFDGNEGTFDRRRLQGVLRLMRLRGEHVKVVTGPLSLQRRGERFVVDFSVTLARGNSRLLPGRPGIYKVTTAWRHERGKWRCYHAVWKRRM